MRITVEEAEKWQKIATLLATASKAIADAESILILELKITEGKPSKILNDISDVISGQSYMFTPQDEWCGNDDKGDPIFRTRKPHVAQ